MIYLEKFQYFLIFILDFFYVNKCKNLSDIPDDDFC